MAKNMVMDVRIKIQIHKSQVGYMSNPGLNMNKALRGKVKRNMTWTFDIKMFLSENC